MTSKKIIPMAIAAGLLALNFYPGPVRALDYTNPAGRVLDASTQNYPTASLVNDHGTIYFIRGTEKVPFTSWGAFVGLGYSLKNVIGGDTSSYEPAAYNISTANAAHPWGSWLVYKNTVYYSAQSGLVGVPSAAVFLGDDGQWNMVVPANKYDLAQLQSGAAVLALGDSRLYASAGYSFSGAGQTSLPAGNSGQSGVFPQIPPAQPSAPAQLFIANGTAAGSGSGQLNVPTLAANSPAGQFVIAGTQNQPAAAFNFTASGSPVTIQELDFIISESGVGTTTQSPIAFISAGGQRVQALLFATTSLAYLNLTVPAGSSGINVPVNVDLAKLNPPYLTDNQIFALTLAAVKYANGNGTFTIYPNLTGSNLDLVAGYSSVTLASSTQTLTDGIVQIAKFTVSAVGGNTAWTALPFSLTSIGNASVSSTPANVTVVDETNGAALPINPVSLSLAVGGTASFTLSPSANNQVFPDSPQTYDIYVPVQGAVDASAGYSAIAVSLGAASGFSFTDGFGTALAGGTNLPNYSAYSIRAHN